MENKEIESLKTKEKELREAYLKIQNENIKLKSEIALKCDEYLYSVSIIEDLKEQLKVFIYTFFHFVMNVLTGCFFKMYLDLIRSA